MRLLINQRTYHFKIFNSKDAETLLYSAEIFTNRKKERLKVFNSDNNVVATIRQTNYKWFQYLWNQEYEISLLGTNDSYNVRCVKYMKRHWTATSFDNKKQLDYYGHNGHKKSVFLNGKQIALIDKKYFHFFNRDTIYIDFDNDQNPLLLLTFALFFELNVDTDTATFTIDFGNFGQDRKVDETWRPKK